MCALSCVQRDLVPLLTHWITEGHRFLEFLLTKALKRSTTELSDIDS